MVKYLGSGVFTSEFYQTLKNKNIPNLQKQYQSTEKVEVFPNLFYKIRVTLLLKQTNITQGKETAEQDYT